MAKKKMKKAKFLGIWIPCISVAALLGLALEIVSNNSYLSNVFDIYLGRGEIVKTVPEGTKDWDTEYYKKTLKNSDESKSAGEKLTEDICEEGIVMLKNDGSLPISTSTEITLLGRGSIDPVYGGSGSGNVDTKKAATPKTGLEKAGFTVDQDAYNFYKGLDLAEYQKQVSKWIIIKQVNSSLAKFQLLNLHFKLKKIMSL